MFYTILSVHNFSESWIPTKSGVPAEHIQARLYSVFSVADFLGWMRRRDEGVAVIPAELAETAIRAHYHRQRED